MIYHGLQIVRTQVVGNLFCVFLEGDIDDCGSCTRLEEGNEAVKLLIQGASNVDFEGKTMRWVLGVRIIHATMNKCPYLGRKTGVRKTPASLSIKKDVHISSATVFVAVAVRHRTRSTSISSAKRAILRYSGRKLAPHYTLSLS